jgi:hypothetical protein
VGGEADGDEAQVVGSSTVKEAPNDRSAGTCCSQS